jgi:hypothetical protein
MTIRQGTISHATNTTNLGDLLERVLDKGVVIVGDIKVKLVDVELLSVQLRLLICSVEKAQEIGVDWWANQGVLRAPDSARLLESTLAQLNERLTRLETAALPDAQEAPSESGNRKAEA